MTDVPMFVWVEVCLIVLGVCAIPFLWENANE